MRRLGQPAWEQRLREEAIELLSEHYPRDMVVHDLETDLSQSEMPATLRLEAIVASLRKARQDQVLRDRFPSLAR